ncbi:MAG: F0F1 ATP synthase subunit epsilon [Deltaproteobacteria bacterium]|nr:F0F1 ATP synthase subunit epsilon [Deltaproteobacteria bacterium]MBW2071732.1 F0F1 ATP synthase subunit epsilon [Deltaproteobacteria bacterium]
MAEKLLHLEVVTPERTVISAEAEIVVGPGFLGEFGVLYNHIPYLVQLQPGELRYRIGNQVERVAISGGYAEVLPTKVTVLATAAERPTDIDLERALAARERAERRLKERTEDIDFARAEAALKRAIARIKVAEEGKSG